MLRIICRSHTMLHIGVSNLDSTASRHYLVSASDGQLRVSKCHTMLASSRTSVHATSIKIRSQSRTRRRRAGRALWLTSHAPCTILAQVCANQRRSLVRFLRFGARGRPSRDCGVAEFAARTSARYWPSRLNFEQLGSLCRKRRARIYCIVPHRARHA